MLYHIRSEKALAIKRVQVEHPERISTAHSTLFESVNVTSVPPGHLGVVVLPIYTLNKNVISGPGKLHYMQTSEVSSRMGKCSEQDKFTELIINYPRHKKFGDTFGLFFSGK